MRDYSESGNSDNISISGNKNDMEVSSYFKKPNLNKERNSENSDDDKGSENQDDIQTNNENNEKKLNIGELIKNDKKEEKKNEGNLINIRNIEDKLILEKEEGNSKKEYHIVSYSGNESFIKSRINYEDFINMNEALIKKFPYFCFPKVSPKETIKEERQLELEYYLNTVYQNFNLEVDEILQRGTIKDISNQFYYPYCTKAINDSKSIFSSSFSYFKSMKVVSQSINYFKSENKNDNDISKIEECSDCLLDKFYDKFKTIQKQLKDIYKNFVEENELKKCLKMNLLFIKNQISNFEEQKNFDKIISENENYDYNINKKFEEFFFKDIIMPINFGILDMEGLIQAKERAKTYFKMFNKIIKFENKIQSQNIIEEKKNCKKDMENYKNNLISEIKKLEKKLEKCFRNTMNNLYIFLKNTTENVLDKYKNTFKDIIKEIKEK